MKQKPQAGFAHVGIILLVVIVLAVIGGSGYYVYHKNNETKMITNNSQNKPKSEQQAASSTTYDECIKTAGSKQLETYPEQCVTKGGKTFTDTSNEIAKWTSYTAPDNTFSMRIPDGWNIDQNSETSGNLQIMDNSLAIVPGTKGTFYVTPGYGKDYDTGMSIDFYDPSTSSVYFQSDIKGGTRQASLKTQNGLEIQKYFYKQTTDPGTPGLQKGDESYTYAIFSGSKLVLCWYGFDPSSQTDYHTNIESALETVKIL